MPRARTRKPRPITRDLSPREVEVLQACADGLTVMETATLIWLSPHTVRSHRKKVNLKLGARNGPHAVAIGFRNGWLT